MGANPWAGVLRQRDYVVLAVVFGFKDWQECMRFFEEQQRLHEHREVARDRRRA